MILDGVKLDEQITEARRCLEYAKTSSYLRDLVASAPPFSPEQRLRIRAILCNPAGSDAASSPDVVYYAERDGLIKIGTSANVQRRMQELEAELLASEPGDRKLEDVRHQQFAATHSHSEWFRPSSELRQHIDAIRAKAI
jgi:T5orf172 domain